MQNKSKTKVVYKDYSLNQILLLPPSLEEMIDPNHPVRVVNQVIESLDIDLLINKYKGGGCSSYHPLLFNTLHQLLTGISSGRCGGKPEMARTSAFFGSVMPKALCQKRLKLSFPAPFFFGSFLFGRTKRTERSEFGEAK